MDKYSNIPGFDEYVDRYCKQHKISVKEALEHKTVKDVAENYKIAGGRKTSK